MWIWGVTEGAWRCPGHQSSVWSPHSQHSVPVLCPCVPGLPLSMQISALMTRLRLHPGGAPESSSQYRPSGPGQGSALLKYSVDTGQKIQSARIVQGAQAGHVMGGAECGDNQERAFHLKYMGTHNTWPKLPSQITSWIMRLDTKPGQRTHYPNIRWQLVSAREPGTDRCTQALSHPATF